jgi:hypothetical protein
MSSRPPFVLVHGGRHGGWCWARGCGVTPASSSSASHQRSGQRYEGGRAARSAVDERFSYRVLDAPHDAMVTAPELVVQLLIEAAELR